MLRAAGLPAAEGVIETPMPELERPEMFESVQRPRSECLL